MNYRSLINAFILSARGGIRLPDEVALQMELFEGFMNKSPHSDDLLILRDVKNSTNYLVSKSRSNIVY